MPALHRGRRRRLDSGTYVCSLRRFQPATSSAPRAVGLHNYGDVTYGRTTGRDVVLAAVPGRLWIEETAPRVAPDVPLEPRAAAYRRVVLAVRATVPAAAAGTLTLALGRQG